MDIYTMESWGRDGSLNPAIGQIVADDVVIEMRDCVPPATWEHGIFQPGEAYSHDPVTFCPTYMTFRDTKDGWVYDGLKPRYRA